MGSLERIWTQSIVSTKRLIPRTKNPKTNLTVAYSAVDPYSIKRWSETVPISISDKINLNSVLSNFTKNFQFKLFLIKPPYSWSRTKFGHTCPFISDWQCYAQKHFWTFLSLDAFFILINNNSLIGNFIVLSLILFTRLDK